MVRVEFTIRLETADALVAARNSIFQAMFERAAGTVELDVHFEQDEGNAVLWVDDLTTAEATSLLTLLQPLDLLAYVRITVDSKQERLPLSQFPTEVTIDSP